MGGLSKKAFQITTIAGQEKLPYLFVDSGALLFKQNTIRSGMQEQETTTAKGIAGAMQAMNSRAVGIAAQDLAGGIDLLKEIRDNQKLNWLSMNLVDSEKREPVFTPFVNTRVGSTQIAILGLTDEQAARKNDPGYIILPWQEVLPEVLAGIDHKADMVILLSSYPEEVNMEIARTLLGIDLILESGHSATNLPPHKAANTMLTKVAGRGKYVGMMRINWTDPGHWGENCSDRIRTEQNHLDRINWQIGRIEKRARKNEVSTDERYTQLLTERKQSEQKIVDMEKAAEETTEEPCSFTNRFIALKSSMPEDREVQAIIDQTTLEVNKLNRKRVRTGSRQQHSALSTLAGWQQCRQCHPKQTAFWQTTDHAKAWQTLADANQQFNEDCLLCHVTLPYYDAARVRSEKLLLQLPQSLYNVGCESCHGPAAAHSKQPEAVETIFPNEDTCKGCHTPDHDDNFIFADKVQKVRCPKG